MTETLDIDQSTAIIEIIVTNVKFGYKDVNESGPNIIHKSNWSMQML